MLRRVCVCERERKFPPTPSPLTVEKVGGVYGAVRGGVSRKPHLSLPSRPLWTTSVGDCAGTVLHLMTKRGLCRNSITLDDKAWTVPEQYYI